MAQAGLDAFPALAAPELGSVVFRGHQHNCSISRTYSRGNKNGMHVTRSMSEALDKNGDGDDGDGDDGDGDGDGDCDDAGDGGGDDGDGH